MKRKLFWYAMAAAVILTGMNVLTSCSKDDEPEVIIKSEVMDFGIDNKVTAKTTTEGTELSYDTWIIVNQVFGQAPATRSSSDNGTRIAVTLTNKLQNLNSEIQVDDFEFGGEPAISISYGVMDVLRDGYINVSDSVMLYSVEYDNFSFSFEIPYKVASYDDGYSRQVLPYYYYSNVVDKGSCVTDMDIDVQNTEKGQNVWVQKLYTHKISVELQEQNYDVTANIILKKCLNTNSETTVVSCELIDSGISNVQNADDYTTYTSWITVKQTMLSGTSQEKTYTADALLGNVSGGLLPYKRLQSKNIVEQKAYLLELNKGTISASNFVYVNEIKSRYIIEYNMFTIDFDIMHQEAVYDDGISVLAFPFLRHSDFTHTNNLNYFGDFDEDGASFEEHWFFNKLSSKFGNATHTATRDFQAIIPK
ncbi:MAG: hypothetical protein LBF79_04405 [Dysgonamonadaceae bacterium]|jgi:hypothetical protein|nr:hypothetical protein [Dysgonamonadaceae bacterium]